MLMNYWVGKRTTDDEAILVYDPSIQTSDTDVYLFNYRSVQMEQLDRISTRKIVRKVIDLPEQQMAIETYLDWLRSDLGRKFTGQVDKTQEQQQAPRNLSEFYGEGYRAGFRCFPARTFDVRTSEICRREYNRGYIDGANDFSVEEELRYESRYDEDEIDGAFYTVERKF
jgi:hypothetical protein